MSKPDLSFSWSVPDWGHYDVGQKVISDPVVWQGFKWSIVVYPNGTVPETSGKVGLFVTVKSLNASQTTAWALDVTFALSICERPPAKATCCFRNDADIWGFKDIMLRDSLDETKPITCHAQIYLSKFPAASSLEPPPPPKHPLLSLSSYFNDEATSDMLLKCGDRSFHVHKIVLIATSEYFKAMWRRGGWKEEGESEVEITDCEPQILDSVLNYLYQGEAGLPVGLTWEQCAEILQASCFFQIPSLQDVLIAKLSGLLSSDSLVGTFVVAKRLELPKLGANVLDFVRTKYGSIREQRKQILATIREEASNTELLDLLDTLMEAAEQLTPPQPNKKTV
ncbi:BTB/POZ protein [Hyaloraphidium curvatum]|nr:BTB/POZ protein [Hyaloraphidium curvatum]